jgi:hypothetical protein
MLKHDKYLENAFCNVGDTIQDLAMDYIFSQISIDEKDVRYLARDSDYLREPQLGETMIPAYVHLFQNAEARLPFPSEFSPVFVSLLLYQDGFDHHPELVEYIKQYEPVGCRDEQSKRILIEHGIDAYLMGCFTVCLPTRKEKPKNGKVFFVDTPPELDRFVPDEIAKKATYISHVVPYAVYPVTVEEDIRQRNIAQGFLDRYEKEAGMVVTSRLHCAVPCMAMGIPVILVRENFDFRFSWLEKLLPLYYLDAVGSINWYPKAVDLEEVKYHMFEYIRKSLLRLPNSRQHLVALDDFFESRKKVVINKVISEKIDSVSHLLTQSGATYGIWGAGAHGMFVYHAIKEKYPSAQLITVVDKYVKGMMYNAPIVTGDSLKDPHVDHWFITTLPGKQEAIIKMEELYGSEAVSHYTVITSRQIC